MATDFVRPTPAEILARVQSDIEGELDGVSAQLRRRPEFAHAVGITGVANELHGHLAWVAEQIIVDQASERFLLRWADLFGLSRKAAIAATGTITVTGSGTLPADTEWVRVQDGQSFTVDTLTAVSTTASVAVTAAVGGTAGNLATGETLQLVSAVSGINNEATVASPGFSGGAEIESIESLLERLLDRIQTPPLGGAPGDHVAWALEVPGVTRAWEYKGTDGDGNPGIGKVAVTFVVDDEVDIIPDSDKVDEVQEYLDARSPAEVIVFAPTGVAFDYELILDPSADPDVEAAVEAEVRDMLRRDSEPGGTILLSRFNEAVSIATGEISHQTVVPTGDKTHDFGEIAVYGAPTFS